MSRTPTRPCKSLPPLSSGKFEKAPLTPSPLGSVECLRSVPSRMSKLLFLENPRPTPRNYHGVLPGPPPKDPRDPSSGLGPRVDIDLKVTQAAGASSSPPPSARLTSIIPHLPSSQQLRGTMFSPAERLILRNDVCLLRPTIATPAAPAPTSASSAQFEWEAKTNFSPCRSKPFGSTGK